MNAAKIRSLNDAFRTTMTGGVDAFRRTWKAMVIRRVATFSEFSRTTIPTWSTISVASSRWTEVLLEIDAYDPRWNSGRTTRPIRVRRRGC